MFFALIFPICHAFCCVSFSLDAAESCKSHSDRPIQSTIRKKNGYEIGKNAEATTNNNNKQQRKIQSQLNRNKVFKSQTTCTKRVSYNSEHKKNREQPNNTESILSKYRQALRITNRAVHYFFLFVYNIYVILFCDGTFVFALHAPSVHHTDVVYLAFGVYVRACKTKAHHQQQQPYEYSEESEVAKANASAKSAGAKSNLCE